MNFRIWIASALGLLNCITLEIWIYLRVFILCYLGRFLPNIWSYSEVSQVIYDFILLDVFKEVCWVSRPRKSKLHMAGHPFATESPLSLPVVPNTFPDKKNFEKTQNCHKVPVLSSINFCLSDLPLGTDHFSKAGINICRPGHQAYQ